MWYINSGLVLSGVCILSFSFFLITRIMSEFNPGNLKKKWIILLVLLVIFIAGYLGFWIFILPNIGVEALIVSIVFFLGAVFTVVVSWLILQTNRDIKRIATLEQESITDPLLNIYNRRYLEQRLKEETARMNRYKLPLSLLLLDIDHFKNINDRYGHLIGDKVLKKIGEILMEQVRETDLPARYGGEEIAILLPNTREKEAFNMAERIRLFIEQTNFNGVETNDGALNCTVSIGITSAKDNNCQGTDLLNRADIAMYQAKKTGRNRVVAFKPEYEKSQVTVN